MGTGPTPPQIELEKTYNAAADHYDHPAVSFWDRFGERTVERVSLVPGMNVLDVCCWMGGSALPAAERVGPTGKVLAIDLAQNLLRKGSKRAEAAGLTNIEFRRGDLEVLPFPDQSFDAVISVFGIFFVSDLAGTVRGLWRLDQPIRAPRNQYTPYVCYYDAQSCALSGASPWGNGYSGVETPG